MTPEQARSLATRTLAAIDDHDMCSVRRCAACDADRERIAADLAGLTFARWDVAHASNPGDAERAEDHARRYATNLIRTAHLYGVTPEETT